MDPRASIPGIDRLLELARREGVGAAHPQARLVEALRAAVQEARAGIGGGDWPHDPAEPAPYLQLARAWLEADATPSLRPVVNATGVVLHTNLGRAPLATVAREARERVAPGYSKLGLERETGRRGSRYQHCAALVAELTGAEDALVVNNCAGGLVLALSALARGRDVVVSRGELVEIGGGFRIPEVLEHAGAGMREVGATNRTRIEDYRSAIRAGGVGAMLKVHRSNFRVVGFTEAAELEELGSLAREAGVPLIHDLGSGLLADPEALGLPPEPTPRESLRRGADLVIFSGDKLLGGPQAGLISGTSDLISVLRRTPLTRALRVDKATLAGLEATLRLYRDPDRAYREIPVLRMLSQPLESLQARALGLQRSLAVGGLPDGCRVVAEPGEGRVGGGTYPEHPVSSWTVRLTGPDAGEWASRLREGDPPLVARVEDDALVLDLRTVEPLQDPTVAALLLAAVPRPDRSGNAADPPRDEVR
jgi:L-seryl-tRNA(Ser) seleniumtransferase